MVLTYTTLRDVNLETPRDRSQAGKHLGAAYS